jgi:hypothetical protein
MSLTALSQLGKPNRVVVVRVVDFRWRWLL